MKHPASWRESHVNAYTYAKSNKNPQQNSPKQQPPLLLLRQVHAWRGRLSAARVEDVVGKSQFASDTKPNVASLVFPWNLQFPRSRIRSMPSISSLRCSSSGRFTLGAAA